MCRSPRGGHKRGPDRVGGLAGVQPRVAEAAVRGRRWPQQRGHRRTNSPAVRAAGTTSPERCGAHGRGAGSEPATREKRRGTPWPPTTTPRDGTRSTSSARTPSRSSRRGGPRPSRPRSTSTRPTSTRTWSSPGRTCPTRSSPSASCPSRRTSSPVRVASWCSTAAGSPPPGATSCSAGTARPDQGPRPPHPSQARGRTRDGAVPDGRESMSEQSGHTVPPRDVPPPRPVGAAGEPVEGEVMGPSGLGAAARSLADAVSGLLGRDGGSSGSGSGSGPGRGAASVLGDLVGTLGQAARSARPRPGGGPRRAAGGDRLGDLLAAAPPRLPRRDRERPPRAPPRRAAGGDRLGDLLAAAAPRLPVRDRERLRRAHPGATDDEIAEALAARAARLTGAVGAATGGLAAAQRFLPSALIAVPVELAAQTLLVGAVEVVLVGELHELAGRSVAGDQRARVAGYVSSWQARRAAGGAGTRGLAAVLGAAGASALRRQANRRLARGRSATAPMVLGASLTARANSKETVALARELWAELRGAPPR